MNCFVPPFVCRWHVLLCALCLGKNKYVGLFLTIIWLVGRRKIHRASILQGVNFGLPKQLYSLPSCICRGVYSTYFMLWLHIAILDFSPANVSKIISYSCIHDIYMYMYLAIITVWNLFWWHKWRRWGSGHVMWASVLWTMLERVSSDLYSSF